MIKMIVGVSGGTASGKTTFAHAVMNSVADTGVEVDIMSVDMFYPELAEEVDKLNHNFDVPEALDVKLFIEKILELNSVGESKIPHHDFATTTVTHDHTHIDRPDVLIIEGMMLHTLLKRGPDLLSEEEIKSLGLTKQELTVILKRILKKSLNIFVGVDEDAILCAQKRLERRKIRDEEDRGVSPEDTEEMWKPIVREHFRHVEPQKEVCDEFVYENNFDNMIEKISKKIVSTVKKRSVIKNTSTIKAPKK